MKSIVNRFLTKYPKLHTVIAVARELSSVASFRYHVVAMKPYFGHHMASHQVWPKRVPFMKMLMERVCSERESLLMLEIGSWGGESAILWAEAAKQGLKEKHQAPIRIICVDPWTSYPSLRWNPRLWAMRRAADNDKIFSLFLHNVKASGHSDVIIPLRTWSQVVAGLLRANLFDMIFIDGDHSYSAVTLDIRNFAPLLKEGGYICGDDLELQLSEIDENSARTLLDEDVVRDVKRGTHFHPGVTVAVGEFFGEVSVYAGFWVMQKTGSSWKKVPLK